MIRPTAREESWVQRAMNVRTIIGSSRPLSVSSTCARAVLLARAPVPDWDRADRSQHMNRVAVVITDDMAGPDAGQDQAVRPLHSMLERDRRTGRSPRVCRVACAMSSRSSGCTKASQSPMRLRSGAAACREIRPLEATRTYNRFRESQFHRQFVWSSVPDAAAVHGSEAGSRPACVH